MGYIAFLDLLGTKDFSGNPAVYTEKISCFYEAAKECSYHLNGVGNVGIFSDCLYAESKELLNLVRFLTSLRDRLCSQRIFFAAALMKGTIGVVKQAKAKQDNFFGVAFENSMIADVYIKQTQFKGIGIFVDKPIKAEVENLPGVKVVKSAFMKDIESGEIIIYYDIAYNLKNDEYAGYEQSMLKVIVNQCLLAYTQSDRFGRYYLSILATILNSCADEDIRWDGSKNDFSKCPLIFSIIMKMAENPGEVYSQIKGLDLLCLVILNAVFNHEDIGDIDRKMIVKKIMAYECLEEKYSHSINKLPQKIFDNSNRERIIEIYQSDVVSHQVDELFRVKSNLEN
ncbi:MAG: hypothetical protein LUH14_06225 [Clostridiaceae bacterium]|nr:hypothetical protein [Clostridiaceae bacterium]